MDSAHSCIFSNVSLLLSNTHHDFAISCTFCNCSIVISQNFSTLKVLLTPFHVANLLCSNVFAMISFISSVEEIVSSFAHSFIGSSLTFLSISFTFLEIVLASFDLFFNIISFSKDLRVSLYFFIVEFFSLVGIQLSISVILLFKLDLDFI
jgi:hypothetical protein